MAILVTGAKGYIGSHVCLALQDAGEDVIKLDDCEAAESQQPEDGPNFICKSLESLQLHDLTHRGITDVVHLAALVNAAESVHKPSDYYATNVYGTMLLMEILGRLGSVENVVFASSAAVYASGSSPTSTMGLLRPANPYGHSKMMGERIVKDMAKAKGINTAILRFFNVAGADLNMRAGPHEKVGGVVKVLADCALKKKSFTMYGSTLPTFDGSSVRDYIHVSDVADAVYKSLDLIRRQDGESFTDNVCTGIPVSTREVFDVMRRVSGTDLVLDARDARPGEIPEMYGAQPNTLRRKAYWDPRRSDIVTICNSTYEWLMKRKIDNAK